MGEGLNLVGRRNHRPLWRSLLDALVFAAVLVVVTLVLDHFNILDVGTGNASVKDGDSLVLNGIEVRLHGIDAPEYNQRCEASAGEYPCGREAARALRNLLRGRTINCRGLDTDRYGRAVSVCKDGDLEINREMVRQGWAVAYIRHSVSYLKAQQEAKQARRGIWQGRFEMPESYRARNRKVFGDAGAGGEVED